MGRRCAWCESILPPQGYACSPASDAICRGCFEELELALARSGMRLPGRSSAASADPTQAPVGV